jgi:hypothetical protein
MKSYLARTADAEIQQAISCAATTAALQARVVQIVDRSYLQVERNRPVLIFNFEMQCCTNNSYGTSVRYVPEYVILMENDECMTELQSPNMHSYGTYRSFVFHTALVPVSVLSIPVGVTGL